MIIETKRPTRIFVLDTAITTLAWIAFVYQFTKGVVFLLSDHPGTHLSNFLGVSVSPTMATLIACMLVCLFNAALVYIWGWWQKIRLNPTKNQRTPLELSNDILADHFSLSPQQLHDVRDSRVTVVYHSPTGGITHLETGDLHLQQVPSHRQETKLRVA